MRTIVAVTCLSGRASPWACDENDQEPSAPAAYDGLASGSASAYDTETTVPRSPVSSKPAVPRWATRSSVGCAPCRTPNTSCSRDQGPRVNAPRRDLGSTPSPFRGSRADLAIACLAARCCRDIPEPCRRRPSSGSAGSRPHRTPLDHQPPISPPLGGNASNLGEKGSSAVTTLNVIPRHRPAPDRWYRPPRRARRTPDTIADAASPFHYRPR
jgi:hypothetical protein